MLEYTKAFKTDTGSYVFGSVVVPRELVDSNCVKEVICLINITETGELPDLKINSDFGYRLTNRYGAKTKQQTVELGLYIRILEIHTSIHGVTILTDDGYINIVF